MQTAHLITMANQIGDFFKSFPDETQAKKDISDHLNKFWAASMRQQLMQHIQQTNGEGLHALVRAAALEYLDKAT